MEKKIIEINGVKLEIDLREATTIDTVKVGDAIKLLKKKYSDSWDSFPGTIVGFDCFKTLPTIIVAYIENSYSDDALLKFAYINAEAKDCEIVKCNEHDLVIERGTILNRFDRAIGKAEREIEDLKIKKRYFETQFSRFFSEAKK